MGRRSKKQRDTRAEFKNRQKARGYLQRLSFDPSTRLQIPLKSFIPAEAERRGIKIFGLNIKADIFEIAVAFGYKPFRAPVERPIEKAKPFYAPRAPGDGDSAPSQQAIDEFYASWEWSRARYGVIRATRSCLCCGASRAEGVKLVVDHIKPIRHFWTRRLDPTNLQVLCDPCNKGKGSWDTTDWRSPENSLLRLP